MTSEVPLDSRANQARKPAYTYVHIDMIRMSVSNEETSAHLNRKF